MDNYISISQLNDFIFCPYSIYLHNVYVGVDESLYHAFPQERGNETHKSIDSDHQITSKYEIKGMSIISEELGLIGKIDIFNIKEKRLLERKYEMIRIYKGQLLQIWAQYFCMIEMGYTIDRLAFHISSTNKTILIDIPDTKAKEELKEVIRQFRQIDLPHFFQINTNKCTHCIYCNLCDKTNIENVY